MLAAAIAWFASRLRWLSWSGAVAATAVGTAVLAGGGMPAGIVLVVFFVTSSVLTKLAQVRRPRGHAPNRSGRTARQVLANGAWAALGAALIPVSATGWPLFTGALAAAQADTWSTEVGAFSTVPPRLVTTGSVVPPGTSGGVTPLGTLGGVLGAGAMAVVVFVVGPAAAAIAAFGSGVVGTLVDSVLGATVQAGFFCEQCRVPAERAHHDCGHTARRLHGFARIDNDIVNFMTTGIGGAVAVAATHLL